MAKKILSLKSTEMKKKKFFCYVFKILADFKQFDCRKKTSYAFKWYCTLFKMSPNPKILTNILGIFSNAPSYLNPRNLYKSGPGIFILGTLTIMTFDLNA